jgi:hypothetical protein
MSKFTLGMAHSDYTEYPLGPECIDLGGDRCGDRPIHDEQGQRMVPAGPMTLA